MTNPHDADPPTQQFPPQQPRPYQYGSNGASQDQWTHYAPHSAPPEWNFTSEWSQPAQSEKSKAPIFVLVGLVGLVALGAGGFFIARGGGVGQPAPETQTVVVTSTSQRPTPETTSLPPTSKTAAPTTTETQRTFGPGEPRTSVTSDEFAEAVGKDFAAYYNEHKRPPSRLTTYSPVTYLYYDMSCQPTAGGFSCSGGNNAVVFIPEL